MAAAVVDLQRVLTHWDTNSDSIVSMIALGLTAAFYLRAAARPSPRGRRWPRARTAWFIAGIALLMFVFDSGLEVYDYNPAVHTVQHMLTMMAVPPLLALGAPIVLLLRTLPPAQRRHVTDALHDPSLRVLSGRWAPILLPLDYYATMYMYQLTPLRTYSEQQPLLHNAVHLYMLLCGLSFWWPIAAVDPVRFHPTHRTKQLMILTGLPALTLLGGIALTNGNTSAGWAYIISGTTLTVLGALLVAGRELTHTRPSRPTLVQDATISARTAISSGELHPPSATSRLR